MKKPAKLKSKITIRILHSICKKKRRSERTVINYQPDARCALVLPFVAKSGGRRDEGMRRRIVFIDRVLSACVVIWFRLLAPMRHYSLQWQMMSTSGTNVLFLTI